MALKPLTVSAVSAMELLPTPTQQMATRARRLAALAHLVSTNMLCPHPLQTACAPRAPLAPLNRPMAMAPAQAGPFALLDLDGSQGRRPRTVLAKPATLVWRTLYLVVSSLA